MKKIAIYGKGGIGKSTIVTNVAVSLARRGLKVMQIGCDPKADSTVALQDGRAIPSVLSLLRTKGAAVPLEELVHAGSCGVFCVEAGGPVPGMGCAGRGIIAALEALERKGAYQRYQPDVVLYDVLGDVVCGGFTQPMRRGYADAVFIVTSGENMSIHAAAAIAMAVENFRGRGYAPLGGFILNRRGVANEDEKVMELCGDFHSSLIGTLDWSQTVQQAESLHQAVVTAFPESKTAEQFHVLSEAMMQAVGGLSC